MKVGRAVVGAVVGWLAWKRRRRANKALFVLSTSLAFFVTVVFLWATLNPAPGDAVRYFALYWVWGLCAIGLLFGMAEWKTSPLRGANERGRYWILLYLGALLIIARALNSFLYYGPPPT
jgi:Na+-transporting NADH:ubiquinone oxidoreductase subunit NqrB